MAEVIFYYFSKEEKRTMNAFCVDNEFKKNGNIYMIYNGNSFGKGGFGIADLT